MADRFDRVIDRRGTGSLKWDIYADRDVIPMWVADMDIVCAEAIGKAFRSRVEHEIFGYTWTKKSQLKAVVDWVEYRHGWSIKPEWIVWMPGLVSALNIMCRGFADKGEEVITFTPVYHPFLEAPGNMDRGLVTCPLKRENGKYTFDIELFESLITDKTRVLLLCNPHNPVGRVWNEKEIQAVAEICLKNNISICSDEIHCDLILGDNKHIVTATLSDEVTNNTVTLMAPSKTFNVPGLGCSFAVIPNEKMRETFKHSCEGVVPHVNTFGYIACEAAFNDCRDWHRELLEYLTVNSEIVYNAINSIDGMCMDRVEATYLAWINVEELKLDSNSKFFAKAGVGISEGEPFGDERFIRLNFGCPKSVLEEALGRIKKAVQ